MSTTAEDRSPGQVLWSSFGTPQAEASARVEQLGKARLLGPDILLIHCLDLSAEAWRMIADSGVKISLPVTSDASIGIWDSVPAIQPALDAGVRPSLSVDVEVALSPDMFTQMRALFNIQRMAVFQQRYRGDGITYPDPITTREVLEFATLRGAEAVGLERRTGSLTPGKEADIVSIDAMDWNTFPLNNAYGTVVVAAETRNVDAVFVAGDVRKWNGALLSHQLADVRRIVEDSRDHILEIGGFELDVVHQKYGLMAAHQS